MAATQNLGEILADCGITEDGSVLSVASDEGGNHAKGDVGMRTRLGQGQIDAVIKRYTDGEKAADLAREFGKGDTWIYGLLARRGIPRRTGAKTATSPPPERPTKRPASSPASEMPNPIVMVDAEIARLNTRLEALTWVRDQLSE